MENWEFALNVLCAVEHAEHKYKKELSEFKYKDIYKSDEPIDREDRYKKLKCLVLRIQDAWWDDDFDNILKLVKCLYVTLDAEKYHLDYKKAFVDLDIINLFK